MKLLAMDGKCNACGDRVRQAREKTGLSQEGHSLTQKAVSRIETGIRVVPDYEIPLLAEALGVDPLWLLGLSDIP